jgi:hypothetical protein
MCIHHEGRMQSVFCYLVLRFEGTPGLTQGKKGVERATARGTDDECNSCGALSRCKVLTRHALGLPSRAALSDRNLAWVGGGICA